MSKTPRTDALVKLQEDAFGIPGNLLATIVSAKFARDLERENAQLTEIATALMNAVLHASLAPPGVRHDARFWPSALDRLKPRRMHGRLSPICKGCFSGIGNK